MPGFANSWRSVLVLSRSTSPLRCAFTQAASRRAGRPALRKGSSPLTGFGLSDVQAIMITEADFCDPIGAFDPSSSAVCARLDAPGWQGAREKGSMGPETTKHWVAYLQLVSSSAWSCGLSLLHACHAIVKAAGVFFLAAANSLPLQSRKYARRQAVRPCQPAGPCQAAGGGA